MADGPDLTGTHIAFFATDGVEQVELTGPWEAAKAAGATVELVSIVDEVQGDGGPRHGQPHSAALDLGPLSATWVDPVEPADSEPAI